MSARHRPPRWTDAARARDAAWLAVVTVAYVLVTVWWCWPGILHWSRAVAYAVGGKMEPLQHADFFLNAWTITWVSHALATDPSTLFDGNTFFPAKRSVAFSESMLGYVPLFAPVYWATGNQVLALNVMAALTYPLAALSGYLLARLWLGHASAALAGFFFAFTVGRYTMVPHYQCLGIAGFPLVVLAIERWLRDGRTRHLVLLVLAVVLQAMASAYYLYTVVVLLLGWTPASLWHHRARLDRRRVAGLLAAGAASGAIVVALMWPYLVLRAHGLVPHYDDERTSLGLVPWIARDHLRTVLFVRGPGVLAWLLALVGALPGRDTGARWARRTGLVLVLVGCVAALGPRPEIAGRSWWSPYLLLRDWLPGFGTVRAPGRFAVLAQLGVALLAAVGFERILHSTRHAPRPAPAAVLASAIAALSLALMNLPGLPLRPLPAGDDVPPAYAYLRAHGDGTRALIEIPPPQGVAHRSRRVYLSTTHWQPVVEGYAANGPQHIGYVSWMTRALPGDATLQRLVDVIDVGWLLVHRDELDARGRAAWERAPLPDGLVHVATWDDDVLYRVERAPRDDRRARLVSADWTLDGAPIAPVGRECAGAIRVLGWREPLLARQPLRADVEVSNASRAVWPAFGFLPAGLVALEARVLDTDGRPRRNPERIRLTADVAPGRTVRVAAWIAPLPPGEYVLRLRLVQPSRGTLDDCVPPIDVPLAVAPAAATVRTASVDDAVP